VYVSLINSEAMREHTRTFGEVDEASFDGLG